MRAKFLNVAIGVTALLLGSGAGLRAQVSSPVQTIQGTKQKLDQVAANKAGQQTAKQPSPKAPAPQNKAVASKTQGAQGTGKAPSKTPAAKQPASKVPAERANAKKSPAKKESAKGETQVARRDPFAPLVNKSRGPGNPDDLPRPPGKKGLVIATLRIQGIVHGPNGMIAIVENSQHSVYFLREGDQLFDGRVVRITMEGVTFHEFGKDAFGKPVDREVGKRLYPVVGESQ